MRMIIFRSMPDLLFQPEKTQEKGDQDDDVKRLLLPFPAFQEIADHQIDDESDQDVIKDGDDHMIPP
jgi:hypothetical protein